MEIEALDRSANLGPKVSPMRTALFYGSICAVVMIIVGLALYLAGLENNNLQYLNYLIMLGALILAIKNFRDKELGGYITYNKGLAVGTLTMVVAALIFGIFTYIELAFLFPEMMEEVNRVAEEKLAEKEMSEEQVIRMG